MSTDTHQSYHPATERVRAALQRSFERSDYGRRCLAQRLPGPDGAGSFFLDVTTVEGLRAKLEGAFWRPLNHPAVKAPAVAFDATGIPGRLGVVPLRTLPADTVVTLEDPKGTGFVEAVVRGLGRETGVRQDTATIILGPDQDGAEVLWTVHPGQPVVPSTVPSAEVAGRKMSPDESGALGLRWAKIA